MTQRLEPVVVPSDDPVNRPEQREVNACLLALFHETNEHIRSADQKQVSTVGAYLAMVGLVLSLLPGRVIKTLHGADEGTFVYLFLFIVGCCSSLYQAWRRVWKVHYLETLREIVKHWTLPQSMLPYWLRQPSDEKRSVWHRLNIDNTFLFFTVFLNTALIVVVGYQAWYLLRTDWRTLALGTLFLVYAWYMFLLYKVATNHQGNLIA
jgi:disulfide bond formation protein DsbB